MSWIDITDQGRTDGGRRVRESRTPTSRWTDGSPGRAASITWSAWLEVAGRHGTFGVGSVDYGHIPISADEELECVSFGFFLGSDGDDRYAVLLRGANPQYGQLRVQVEVLAGRREAGSRWLADLPELMRERNVFRAFVDDDFRPGSGRSGSTAGRRKPSTARR